MDKVEFHKIPNYGDHMSLSDFLYGVECWLFMNQDGWGYLATDTRESNIQIVPTDVDGSYQFPEWATHVVWYNR